jgi:tRNA pseudouridine55 synthase
MNGILNLDKPAGITSARAVAIVKRLLPPGAKIGHAGTLDSFATGVLLLLIGRATKSCEAVMDQPKQYEATIKFGATTETLDPQSREEPMPTATRQPEDVSAEEIDEALRQFVGEIAQRPPLFSALKVGGQRASDRVRAGETIQLHPRLIRIESIERLEVNPPFLRVRIDCGRGTYIRSLARDIGEALGTGAYLTQLRRTRIGKFAVESAVTVDQLSDSTIKKLLVPV